MSDALTRRLRELSDLRAPAGREGPLRDYLRAALRGGPWTCEEDALGNLYVTAAGARGPWNLLLLVPMDEAGAVLTHVDEQGRGTVAALGPLPARALAGRRVVLPSGAAAAVAVRRADDGGHLPPGFDRLYLDFGTRSRAETEAVAAVGDPAVPDVRAAPLAGGALCGKALGSRAACAAALAALEEAGAAASGAAVAFLAQDELGHRGVRPAVRRCPAELVVSLGPAAAGDVPRARGSDVRLGAGPVLVLSDRDLSASPAAVEALGAAAAHAGVAPQVAVADPGSCAAGPAAGADTGAPAGALAFPLRHRHSCAEVCDPGDVAALARVVAVLLVRRAP